MKISGKAVSDGDHNFFDRISRQINKYKKELVNHTNIDINLSHVNASSKKSMVELFKQLESMKILGFEVCVNWNYTEEDDEVKELGEIFKSMFDFKINIIKR